MPDDGRFLGLSVSAPTTAPPKAPARLPSAGRLFRLALGAALVVAALVFLQDRFLTMEARHAVLDGAPVTLRSPIEGVLEEVAPVGAGTVMPAGTVLGRLRNPRLDEGRLGDLTRYHRQAEAEATALGRRLDRVELELEQAGTHAAAFAAARSAMMQARLKESDSQLAAAAAREAEALAALRRTESLAATGTQTAAALDAARRAAQVARAELQAAADRKDAMAVETRAVLAGVFASDTANDRSASQISQERLRLLATDLAAMRDEALARAAALARQIAEESPRLDRLRETTLVALSRARLIRRLAQPGEHVGPGQGVLLLADCAQPEVTAAVEPRVFRGLVQGAPAVFLPAGGGDPRHGSITALRATPAAADGSGGRLEVVVALNAEPSDTAACASSRLGRLAFR
jgi:multidrug resistance efflux pump